MISGFLRWEDYAIIISMKKLIALLLLLILISSLGLASRKFEYYPLNVRVKSLLNKPDQNSDAAFVFPIEVTMTGVSKDKKWYRFKVYYDLVFFGKYSFEGWCQVDPFKPFETNATPEVIEIE